MGEFFEPQAGGDEMLFPKPKVFTKEFLTGVVQKSIENGDIKPDDKLAFIAIADENGARAILAVSILDKEKMKIKFNGVFEHEWDGDNRVGAKVIFSVK